MNRDVQRIAVVTSAWGWALPRGAVPALEAICAEMRGDARLSVKELAADIGWPASKLYSAREYGKAVGDPVFVAGGATRKELTAWLRRHPEWRVTWRRSHKKTQISGVTRAS